MPAWYDAVAPSTRIPIRDGEFVTRSGDHFTIGGVRRDLWGTVVGPWFLIQNHADVDEGFRRLSLIFDVVRLHHLDSLYYPNLFGLAAKRDDAGKVIPPLLRTYRTSQFDDAYVEKLDWAISCAERHGVRVIVDGWNLLQLTGADADEARGCGVDCWDDLFARPLRVSTADGSSGAGECYGYVFVDNGLRIMLDRRLAKLNSLVNRYTGRAYADEPTIALWMATNEKDFTGHAIHMWPRKNPETVYQRLWRRKWDNFGLPCPAQWKRNLAIFAAETEYELFDFLAGGMRRRVRQPVISGCMWGNNPFLSLAALSRTSDAIDLHVYSRDRFSTRIDGTLYGELNRMSISTDPRKTATFETLLAACHVDGMPLTITEYAPVVQGRNVREAAGDALEAVGVCATAMIRQDVNLACWFMAYQNGIRGGSTDPYDWAHNNEIMLALADAGNRFRSADRTPGTPGQVRAIKRGTIPESILLGEEFQAADGEFCQRSPHAESSIRSNTISGLRTQIKLPSVKELTWLAT